MLRLSNFAFGGGVLQNTPLIGKILEYIEQNKLGFHTPGHRQGRGTSSALKGLLGSDFLAGDLTEVPGLDNLRNPQECLRETQGLAAAVFGARKTFFLVNGSTVGIEAALLGLNRRGGKVLVARNAHISAVNGLVLSGGQPVLLPVRLEPRWGIALGPDLQVAGEMLAANPDTEAIFLTQPGYQGVGVPARELKRLRGTSPVPLVCDEAHGAHLFFQKDIDLSAQRVQADVVVQSTHKTLGALTQAAMLHVNRQELIEPIKEALDILQTTSPSYLLLASLDAVQDQMREEGEKLLAKSRSLAEELRTRIRRLGHYRLLDDELPKLWQQDPGKIVLSAAELGLSGWELGEILHRKYGIIVELSDYYYCLFLLTHGHDRGDVDRLCSALAEIGRIYPKGKALANLELPAELYEKPVPTVRTPREVYLGMKEKVDFKAAQGRIAGTALTIYPPGIPLVWPGQVIGNDHLAYLQWALSHKLPVHGLDEQGRILVTKGE